MNKPKTTEAGAIEGGRPQFRFEKLTVWKDARRFNRSVYQVTSSFPPDERFGLTSQLRRASVSVSSNIAEGSGRNSDKDFAHFLEQAYGSLMETASQLYLASDLDYVSHDSLQDLLGQANAIAAQLVSFTRALVGDNPSKVTTRRPC